MLFRSKRIFIANDKLLKETKTFDLKIRARVDTVRSLDHVTSRSRSLTAVKRQRPTFATKRAFSL